MSRVVPSGDFEATLTLVMPLVAIAHDHVTVGRAGATAAAPIPRPAAAPELPATAPARIAPARGPPPWDLPDAGPGGFDPHPRPAPAYQFDQRIAC
jgi:hypothetical protein